LDFEEILPAGLGRNLPHSMKGIKVTTVPAAAISFRKSRRDTFLPELGGLCCVIVSRKKSSTHIYKLLDILITA
jgi:hypothetical protein